MKELKLNKTMEIVGSSEPAISSEPLIKNPKPLKQISKEEVERIKSKNKKTQIARIYAKDPIQLTPLSLEELEKIKQLKDKNKKKPIEAKLIKKLDVLN